MYRWLIIMLNFPDMSRIYWSQWSLDSVGPKIDKTGIGCILLLLSHIFDIVLLGGRNWYWVFFFFWVFALIGLLGFFICWHTINDFKKTEMIHMYQRIYWNSNCAWNYDTQASKMHDEHFNENWRVCYIAEKNIQDFDFGICCMNHFIFVNLTNWIRPHMPVSEG